MHWLGRRIYLGEEYIFYSGLIETESISSVTEIHGFLDSECQHRVTIPRPRVIKF